MSKTPRTDAVHQHINDRESCQADDILTACDHARQLERELSHARRLLQNIADKKHGPRGGIRIRVGEQEEITGFLASLPSK